MAEKSEPKVSAPDAAPPVGTALDGLSKQYQFSTKSEVDVDETNPPAGRQIEETLGKPTKGPVKLGSH